MQIWWCNGWEDPPWLPCISGCSHVKKKRVWSNQLSDFTHCRQSDLLLLRVPVFWAALQGPGRLVDCQLLSGKKPSKSKSHGPKRVFSHKSRTQSWRRYFLLLQGESVLDTVSAQMIPFECQSFGIAEDFSDSEVSQEELEYGNSNKDVFCCCCWPMD